MPTGATSGSRARWAAARPCTSPCRPDAPLGLLVLEAVVLALLAHGLGDHVVERVGAGAFLGRLVLDERVALLGRLVHLLHDRLALGLLLHHVGLLLLAAHRAHLR